MAVTEQTTEGQRREDLIGGLRAVAYLLEATPELPRPSSVMSSAGRIRFSWSVWDTEPATAIAALMKLIGGKWDKNDPGDAGGYDETYYILSQPINGQVALEIHSYRKNVCTRVVTGQREVTKMVPTAHKEVTVTEDDVEWVCDPLLAKATS